MMVSYMLFENRFPIVLARNSPVIIQSKTFMKVWFMAIESIPDFTATIAIISRLIIIETSSNLIIDWSSVNLPPQTILYGIILKMIRRWKTTTSESVIKIILEAVWAEIIFFIINIKIGIYDGTKSTSLFQRKINQLSSQL